jgi:hypothetical protein
MEVRHFQGVRPEMNEFVDARRFVRFDLFRRVTRQNHRQPTAAPPAGP